MTPKFKSVTMNPLPEDVLSAILAKLPVKSLLRFRCVSKIWSALIESPYFVDQHLGHTHIKDHQVLIKRQYIKNQCKTLLSFHSPDQDEYTALSIELSYIYGSCNGIVCFSDLSEIHLCNPATRKFLTLPPGPAFDPQEGYELVPLALSLGFGFDESTQDYKVVKLCASPASLYNLIVMGAQIYKLSTNSWRNIDLIIPPAVELLNRGTYSPATVNECLHWDAKDFNSGLQMRVILTFNICTEVFWKMEYPSDVQRSGAVLNLCILAGNLAFIRYPNYENSIYIWVMEEYGVTESWNKKFSLRHPIPGPYFPLYCWNDDKLLLWQKDANAHGRLMFCSLHDDRLMIMKYDGLGIERLFAIAYQETLVSLGGRGHNALSWRNME